MRSDVAKILDAVAPAKRNLFRQEGEYWTIAYEGLVVRLRDTKGMASLAQVLSHPGEAVSAATPRAIPLAAAAAMACEDC